MRDTSFFAAGPRPWLHCSRSTRPRGAAHFPLQAAFSAGRAARSPATVLFFAAPYTDQATLRRQRGSNPRPLLPVQLNRRLFPSELCLRMTRSAEGMHPGRRRLYGRHGLPPSLLSHAGIQENMCKLVSFLSFFQNPLDMPRIAWYISPRNKNGHRPRRKTK
mgnify:CR=1 FL=1